MSVSSVLEIQQMPLWEKLKAKGTPLSFDIEITARCNNDCRHCYINLPMDDLTTRAAELSLAEIEEVAVRAARALVGSAVETATGDQSTALGQVADCPQCGRSHALDCQSRDIAVRGGMATVGEPVGHCSTCRRDFFPST